MSSSRKLRRLGPLALALAVAMGSACADQGNQSAADAEFPSFVDVATDVGLDFRHGAFQWSVSGDPNAMMGGGLCWLDVDRDGWLDLFVVNTWSNGEWHAWNEGEGLPTTRLFRNQEGTFKDATDELGLGLEVRGNGCVAADLDRDGYTDLYVTTERQNVLMWNEGGARFEADGGAAGVNAYGWHAGAAVGDVNQDGWLDLFVAGYADLNQPIEGATRGFPNTFTPEPDLLYINQGAEAGMRPTFVDVATEAGIEPSGTDYGLGAIFSDIDRDGDLDLYVANDTQPNRLYLAEPLGGSELVRFVDAAATAGVDDDNAGMGVAAGDIDFDGRPDLAVTNMAEQGHDVFTSGLVVGAGAGSVEFSSDLEALGLGELGQVYTGWGAAWADLDNDGDLDLAVAHGAIPVGDLDADREPLQIFEQRLVADDEVTRVFVAPPSMSTDQGAGQYLARGLAVADYDNDGDLDLAVGTIGGDLGLLRNEGNSGRWLVVAPDPAAPGTTVSVTTEAGVVHYREILAGSSYLSSEDPRAHFGFGAADGSVMVEVRWPDGTTVVRDAVAIDQIVDISAG